LATGGADAVAVLVLCGGTTTPTDADPKGVVPGGIQADTDAVDVGMWRATVVVASGAAVAVSTGAALEAAGFSGFALSPDLQQAANPEAETIATASRHEQSRRMSSPPDGRIRARSGARSLSERKPRATSTARC